MSCRLRSGDHYQKCNTISLEAKGRSFSDLLMMMASREFDDAGINSDDDSDDVHIDYSFFDQLNRPS